MASKSASSWHPAMMPNSAADLVVRDLQSTSEHAEIPILVDSAASSVAAEEVLPATVLPDINDQGEADEADEADAWLVSEDNMAAEPIETSQTTTAWQTSEATGDDPVQMEPTHSSYPGGMLSEPESTKVSTPPQPIENNVSAEHGDVTDAWLKNEVEGEGGGAWLLQDEELHEDGTCDRNLVKEESTSTQEAASTIEADTNQELVEPQGEELYTTETTRTASVTSTAQHASSMSFARTVSHEISFPGDDDGEWNLGRNETEAAPDFMSESDQTKSFPSVPPLGSETSAQVSLPLASNQASNVMEGDGREAEFEEEEEKEYLMRSPEADSSASWRKHDTAYMQHIPHRSFGVELEDATAMEEEARFEEGLPLIPPTHSLVEDDTQQRNARSNSNLFGEPEDDENDFFGQVNNNAETQNDNEDDVEFLLERKSTMQVMDAVNDESLLTEHSTLNDHLEEHADNSTEGVALGTSDKASGSPVAEDLVSKWEQAFGEDDDDEFLLDDSITQAEDVDPTAFLGSDDEGLLDDDLDTEAPISTTSQPREPAINPYAPASVAVQPTTSYMLPASTGTMPPPTFGYGQQQQPITAPYGSGHFGQTPHPLRPEPARTQSFADKSKVGYSSPYDLPTDLVKPVKPRKRLSLQQQTPTETVPPPPASASLYSPGQPAHPPSAPVTAPVPPISNATRPPPPALHSKNSFFEELPVSSKPRTASRLSQRAPSPGQYMPVGSASQQAPPPPQQPPPMSRIVPPPSVSRMVPPPVPQPAPAPAPAPAQDHSDEVQTTALGIENLMAPPRTNPYANVQPQPSAAAVAAPLTAPSNSSSRYSPAPPLPQGGGVSITSRYSPGLSSGSRPNSSYGAGPPHAALPHLPRTSSPLAHYDSSGAAEGQAYDRRAGSTFEPRLTRMSSLPPTREVDEEEDEEVSPSVIRSNSVSHTLTTSPAANAAEARYYAAPSHAPARHATPPLSPGRAPVASGVAISPPRRVHSNYAPQPASASASGQTSFMPPPRARTQSPSALHMDVRKPSKSTDYAPRPLSAHSPPAGSVASVPAMTRSTAQSSGFAPTSRARGQSITNMMPPTDGRERDPLERWRGAPVMAWGVGGTFVTSFPKSIPRYAMGQTVPVTIRTVGEVKVQNIKDLDSPQDGLAKFPGPLKGKSKKKEAIAWLTAGIDSQEREIPDVSFHSQLSLEAKRSVERLLLWKLLRIFIEHDGILEGSPAVDKAIRQVLAPETVELRNESASLFTGAEAGSCASLMKADAVDEGTVEKIRLALLKGDREAAVWAAVDKRLWGHAMLVSQTVSTDLYKQVAQEFVRKEVNYPGHNNESLAALYKVLSGNYDDCVDELVPSHARAGLQLVSTETSSGPTKDAMDGLDKWRETLTLVLSNRSSEDIRGLNALGKLLSSYGRAEAAHICFIFSRSLSVFGGLDDANSDFVLIGSDHKTQSDQFAKETEALQLSEMYEYGLTLGSGIAASSGAPHLAAYKLQHAVTLAEYGFRDKAIQYCDAIASAIVAQTRRSPYHHPILEASVEDFLARLKSSPKDASSSWMSKPTMDKVSDSVWNRFNKFVSGDENENGHVKTDGDSGPFARIVSSPNISRPPSTSNFDVYGSSPGFQAAGSALLASSGAATSRYAPATTASHTTVSANSYAPPATTQPQHAPLPVSTRRSQEYAPKAYDPAAYAGGAGYTQGRHGSGDMGGGGHQSLAYPGYAPLEHQPMQTSALGYAEPVSATQPVFTVSGGYQPLGLQESPVIHPQPSVNDNTNQSHEPQPYGYEAPQIQTAAGPTDYDDQQGASSGGYEPPSFQPYAYEPSPYQPDNNDDDEQPKSKKKSFMDDDDDDDIPALKKPQDKAKSEKDRENEEMFRKVAEEDAKRAAAAAAATKKGWGFGGWFGGSKKADGSIGGESSSGKPIKAKLGEQSSFVYDPDLGRWINKKPGAENVEAKKATPPPPRSAGPRSMSGTPPPPSTHTPPPAADRMSVPPMGMPPRPPASGLSTAQSMDNLYTRAGPGGMTRNPSSSTLAGPPSRPPTSMSNASSIDDLLGAPAPRKPGQKKPRKSGRYVDVMAKS